MITVQPEIIDYVKEAELWTRSIPSFALGPKTIPDDANRKYHVAIAHDYLEDVWDRNDLFEMGWYEDVLHDGNYASLTAVWWIGDVGSGDVELVQEADECKRSKLIIERARERFESEASELARKTIKCSMARFRERGSQ